MPHNPIHPEISRYPVCIVWNPIPVVRYIIPIIGHLGITTEEGVIRDFNWHYQVTEDNMAYGEPTKYLQLSLDKVNNLTWNEAVNLATEECRKKELRLWDYNCYSLVTMSLNNMMYDGYTSWNTLNLWIYMMMYSKYVRWFLPIIGHMGITTESGVIRDFAGPYFVSEDDMAFGRPTKYWQLSLDKVRMSTWDQAVHDASEEYKGRMHNLCCDNCHSHVAMALNLMNYDGSSKWNMVTLCFIMLLRSRYVSFAGFVKTWLPFTLVATVVTLLVVFIK